MIPFSIFRNIDYLRTSYFVMGLYPALIKCGADTSPLAPHCFMLFFQWTVGYAAAAACNNNEEKKSSQAMVLGSKWTVGQQLASYHFPLSRSALGRLHPNR
jgi:hypothetical protein